MRVFAMVTSLVHVTALFKYNGMATLRFLCPNHWWERFVRIIIIVIILVRIIWCVLIYRRCVIIRAAFDR